VRRHVLGQAQVGVIGDQYSRYLLFDVDYHQADSRRELFLARCKVLYAALPGLARRLGGVWFAECRLRDVGGVRFVLLLPREAWIPRLREAAQNFLAGLDAAYPTLAAVEPFQRVEVYPTFRAADTQGKRCRLPL